MPSLRASWPQSSRDFGLAGVDAGVTGDVEQRLLHEVRDEARDWRHA